MNLEQEMGTSSPASGIGKRRSARRQDSSQTYRKRRAEIAEAAAKVFNRLGFERASLSAVAAELNIDRASLYYYIGSKEELFDEIVRTVVERNADLSTRIRQSDMPPPRKLRELIVALMTSYGDNYPLMFIYIRENLAHVSDKRSEWSRYMRGLNRAIEQTVVEIIEEGYADRSFRDIGPAKVVAAGVFGMLNWTNRWFRPERSDISAARVGETFADMVLAGLESGA